MKKLYVVWLVFLSSRAFSPKQEKFHRSERASLLKQVLRPEKVHSRIMRYIHLQQEKAFERSYHETFHYCLTHFGELKWLAGQKTRARNKLLQETIFSLLQSYHVQFLGINVDYHTYYRTLLNPSRVRIIQDEYTQISNDIAQTIYTHSYNEFEAEFEAFNEQDEEPITPPPLKSITGTPKGAQKRKSMRSQSRFHPY